ncbi:MAG: hypothetical protein K6E24_00795, partial [bacterium]|nr:hypothetical protein [bacterium]
FKDFVNLMTKTTDRLAVGFLTITIALYIIRIILSKRKEMPAELPPQETPTNEPIQITNI